MNMAIQTEYQDYSQPNWLYSHRPKGETVPGRLIKQNNAICAQWPQVCYSSLSFKKEIKQPNKKLKWTPRLYFDIIELLTIQRMAEIFEDVSDDSITGITSGLTKAMRLLSLVLVCCKHPKNRRRALSPTIGDSCDLWKHAKKTSQSVTDVPNTDRKNKYKER